MGTAQLEEARLNAKAETGAPGDWAAAAAACAACARLRAPLAVVSIPIGCSEIPEGTEWDSSLADAPAISG